MTAEEPVITEDGEPDEVTGYRATEAADKAGFSYRQIDYLARNEIFVPSVRPANGTGSMRLYSLRDVEILTIIRRLGAAGLELQQASAAAGQLRAMYADDEALPESWGTTLAPGITITVTEEASGG